MSFILSNPDRNKSAILLSHKKGLKSAFRYSTGQSVEVDKWDFKTQRAIKNNSINFELERHERFLNKVIAQAEAQHITITKEYLFEQFEKEFKLQPKEKKVKAPAKTTDFYKIANAFIKKSEDGSRTTRKGTKITPQRILHYKSFLKNMQDFQAKIDINKIDIKFYKSYIAHRNSLNKKLNTIGKEINIFKAILRDTFKDGEHTNRIFEHPDFVSFEEEVENVYLNDQEIDRLWELCPYKLTPQLELIRDVFIIGCYTALRISDLGVLDKYSIQNNGTLLKIIPDKTNDPVFIPIHHRVRWLMNKYGGKFPKAFSDQRMNEGIKELCYIAGFLEETRYKNTIGGESVRYIEPKWKRITNHTARRSFATNLYLAGFDTISIMKITGHKSEFNFMKYICVTKQQVAERMLMHPYFSGQR